MRRFWSLLLLALLVNAVLATVTLARPVYLADGGIIEAQKVWQDEGKIYLLLNRDSLITFFPEEIDVKRTFAKKAAKGREPIAHKPGPVAAKAPMASVPAPVKVAEKVITPSLSSPAKASAPQVVAKKSPRPGPVAAVIPAESGISVLAYIIIGLALLFILVIIVSLWKVFEKAGEAGWKSLIPLYNYFVLLQIAGCPSWWLLMFLVPVVNLYFLVVMHIRLAEKFGMTPLFGCALFFLGFIFFPLLAFGPATYEEDEPFIFEGE